MTRTRRAFVAMATVTMIGVGAMLATRYSGFVPDLPLLSPKSSRRSRWCSRSRPRSPSSAGCRPRSPVSTRPGSGRLQAGRLRSRSPESSPATRWKKSSEVSRTRSSGHPAKAPGCRNSRPCEIPAHKSAMTEACQPTIYSPSGIAMWRPMAEALAGRRSLFPGRRSSTSPPIHRLEPLWPSRMGQAELGYTHPKYSSAGLLFMTSIAYGITGTSTGLTPDQVYAQPVTQGFAAVAQNTAKYGMVTTALLDMMARPGPDYLHAISAFEEGVCATTWSTPANCVFRWPSSSRRRARSGAIIPIAS